MHLIMERLEGSRSNLSCERSCHPIFEFPNILAYVKSSIEAKVLFMPSCVGIMLPILMIISNTFQYLVHVVRVLRQPKVKEILWLVSQVIR
jgi:hypothetical protein